ncbi:hypothetical protein BDK89_1751 [Ilumatobacter fluminis]|uniref:Uncharacterized protein n=1 Tax=Ilumatobacter fluminis TaxID=467091 RepID=A0A4R7HY80_9ACTN|nr:hypothetical protein [Ilumatobacter fluminis]TDT16167.1 hypothetical protein BDK89_1751 [Ilumatobacter fluminis]
MDTLNYDQAIARLTVDNIEALARTANLGDLNFEEVVPKFMFIRRMLLLLAEQDRVELPSRTATEISNNLSALFSSMDQIEEFTPAQSDPVNARNQIANRVENVRDYFAEHVRPYVGAREVEATEQQIELEQSAEAARAASDEIDALLRSVRKSVGDAGADELSGHYGRQADQHQESARNYLVAVVVLVVLTFAAALYLFDSVEVATNEDGSEQWGDLVRQLTARLFFLGLLAWALAFVVRNYRANQHLAVLNDQRRNALLTYPLFTGSANSETERDLITAELVRAVFAMGDTGYADTNDRTVIEDQASLLGVLMSRRP